MFNADSRFITEYRFHSIVHTICFSFVSLFIFYFQVILLLVFYIYGLSGLPTCFPFLSTRFLLYSYQISDVVNWEQIMSFASLHCGFLSWMSFQPVLRICRRHLYSGVRPPSPKSILDTTIKHLMARLKFWSYGESGVVV